MPIYNAKKDMSVAIESVLAQTYKELELILVDDGSNDGSSEICDEYERKDSRVKVLHQQNSGCAAARNSALKVVQGDYISFVDSDDVVHPKTYEILIKNLENYEADISICDYKEFSNALPTEYVEDNRIEILNNEEAIKELNENAKFTLALWSKVYKKELFYNEEFPLIKTSSDNFIAYRLLYKSRKIVYCSNQYYYYKVNPLSVTHKKGYVNMHILYEGIKIVEYIKEKMPSQYVSTAYKYMLLSLGIYNTMIINNVHDTEKVHEVYRKVKEWNQIVGNTIPMPRKKRYQLNLFLFNRKLYKLMYRLII